MDIPSRPVSAEAIAVVAMLLLEGQSAQPAVVSVVAPAGTLPFACNRVIYHVVGNKPPPDRIARQTLAEIADQEQLSKPSK